jgi:hypothetical protein
VSPNRMLVFLSPACGRGWRTAERGEPGEGFVPCGAACPLPPLLRHSPAQNAGRPCAKNAKALCSLYTLSRNRERGKRARGIR